MHEALAHWGTVQQDQKRSDAVWSPWRSGGVTATETRREEGEHGELGNTNDPWSRDNSNKALWKNFNKIVVLEEKWMAIKQFIGLCYQRPYVNKLNARLKSIYTQCWLHFKLIDTCNHALVLPFYWLKLCLKGICLFPDLRCMIIGWMTCTWTTDWLCPSTQALPWSSHSRASGLPSTLYGMKPIIQKHRIR